MNHDEFSKEVRRRMEEDTKNAYDKFWDQMFFGYNVKFYPYTWWSLTWAWIRRVIFRKPSFCRKINP
jgi:hypothetical protein